MELVLIFLLVAIFLFLFFISISVYCYYAFYDRRREREIQELKWQLDAAAHAMDHAHRPLVVTSCSEVGAIAGMDSEFGSIPERFNSLC